MWKLPIVLCAALACASAATLTARDIAFASSRIQLINWNFENQLREFEQKLHDKIHFSGPYGTFLNAYKRNLVEELAGERQSFERAVSKLNTSAVIRCKSQIDGYNETLQDLSDHFEEYIKERNLVQIKTLREAINITTEAQNDLKALKYEAQGCDTDDCIPIVKQMHDTMTAFTSGKHPVQTENLRIQMMETQPPLDPHYKSQKLDAARRAISCLQSVMNPRRR